MSKERLKKEMGMMNTDRENAALIPARDLTGHTSGSSSLVPPRSFAGAGASPAAAATGRNLLVLNRQVNAIAVPSGLHVSLPAGQSVVLTQELGGNFSVVWQGNLYQISGLDADSLGRQKIEMTFKDGRLGVLNEKHIEQALKTVFDPEIPVNIVDLGLVYGVHHQRIADGEYRVQVTMTLTSAVCGMGPVMIETVKERLLQVPNVTQVEVSLVFDPPWDRSMLSEVARLQLNLM
jgi:probable FeS assembly SUF system protein SufT